MVISSQQPTEEGAIVSILQVRKQVRLSEVTQLVCSVFGTPAQGLFL